VNQAPAKPWYKKKLYWVLGGVLGLSFIAAGSGSSTPTYQPSVGQAALEASAAASLETPSAPQASTTPAVATSTQNTVKKATATIPTQPSTVSHSSDDYYTNVDGNSVHRPVEAPSIPAGATAQCRDGSYSFSQHRSGTCSHHGGVASWL